MRKWVPLNNLNSPPNFRVCKSWRMRRSRHAARTADKLVLNLGRERRQMLSLLEDLGADYVLKACERVEGIHVTQHGGPDVSFAKYRITMFGFVSDVK
jgi:hypothetical protein